MNRNIAVFALIVALMLVGALAARGHDIYHEWKIPGTTTSCCNDQDCRPTKARVTTDGRWEAWDGAEWLLIPENRVLPFQAPDGRSHLCSINGTVLCFTPGEIRS